MNSALRFFSGLILTRGLIVCSLTTTGPRLACLIHRGTRPYPEKRVVNRATLTSVFDKREAYFISTRTRFHMSRFQSPVADSHLKGKSQKTSETKDASRSRTMLHRMIRAELRSKRNSCTNSNIFSIFSSDKYKYLISYNL